MRSTRSPLKQMPLNTPGESPRPQTDDLIFDKGLIWFLAIAFSFVVAGLEWYRYLLRMPPSPWLMTACAVGVTSPAVFKLKGLPELVKQMRQGLDGEKTVGLFLEGLKSRGYQVIHEVCEDARLVPELPPREHPLEEIDADASRILTTLRQPWIQCVTT